MSDAVTLKAVALISLAAEVLQRWSQRAQRREITEVELSEVLDPLDAAIERAEAMRDALRATEGSDN